MGKDFEIKWNRDGLKNLEREVMKNVRKETQAFLDQFARSHLGQPVDQVKVALKRDWKRKMDGTITEPELTEWATVISEGGRIQVR